ncbi:MAG TPA: hypothetical protein PKD85_21240, partial [Saprospiraceae bacterium]|nr:hypothetical protein [Saprospiraceae bacterium]
MFIKVCGLTDIDNANQIIDTGLVNMIGFNFYPFSKRYVDPTYIVNEPFDYIFPIGVFVNEKLETIKKISNDLLLTYIQLHGNEDQDYINECKKLQVG